MPRPKHSAKLGTLPSASSIALGKSGHFVECRRYGTRQRIFWKKIKKIFCRVPDTSPLGKGDVRRAVSVRSTFLCRVLTWHSAKALPSARYIALGKEPFADKSYAGGSLPSVTLGKLFAECKLGFAERLGHSAKNPCPVVRWIQRRSGSRRRRGEAAAVFWDNAWYPTRC